MKKVTLAIALVSSFASAAALAAPASYTLDPDHTHPEFEADHFNGLSVWRGLFKETKGTVTIDKEAGTGTVDVEIATASIDFGMDKLSKHASSPDMLDVAKYPTATYKGKLAKFVGGSPTEVDGELTLHGVTKPVVLKIDSFKCIINPMMKKEVCGADASTVINRADYGVNYGEKFGFKMDVTLHIAAEAIKD